MDFRRINMAHKYKTWSTSKKHNLIEQILLTATKILDVTICFYHLH